MWVVWFDSHLGFSETVSANVCMDHTLFIRSILVLHSPVCRVLWRNFDVAALTGAARPMQLPSSEGITGSTIFFLWFETFFEAFRSEPKLFLVSLRATRMVSPWQNFTLTNTKEQAVCTRTSTKKSLSGRIAQSERNCHHKTYGVCEQGGGVDGGHFRIAQPCYRHVVGVSESPWLRSGPILHE